MSLARPELLKDATDIQCLSLFLTIAPPLELRTWPRRLEISLYYPDIRARP